jgi:hypothetical protein
MFVLSIWQKLPQSWQDLLHLRHDFVYAEIVCGGIDKEVYMEKQQYWEDLVKVTTISEVMYLYNIKHRSTIIDWIDRDEIIATKIGGVFLLSLDSVIEWLGKPRNL